MLTSQRGFDFIKCDPTHGNRGPITDRNFAHVKARWGTRRDMAPARGTHPKGTCSGGAAKGPSCEVILEQTLLGSRLRGPGVHLHPAKGSEVVFPLSPHSPTWILLEGRQTHSCCHRNLFVSYPSPSRRGFLSLGLTLRGQRGPRQRPPLGCPSACRRQLPGPNLLLHPRTPAQPAQLNLGSKAALP